MKYTASPVSYTHLDVYKRQERSALYPVPEKENRLNVPIVYGIISENCRSEKDKEETPWSCFIEVRETKMSC